ncbi:LysR family transcriptional regulator [Enterococcus viikkiensis]|uniref:LysR family transcriptional regulator n=2 Tax=Enterococcus viikkiensis TaxID=930854 RepID=A0ABU3FTI6_9ENTE|nr:LysR family transcriptional regulator [Enterococcus viikkiensis]MDT2829281.1 LysR family transcriptional regulator [Enterococcus viikkiensis]
MDYELLDTFVLAATTLNMTKTANLLFVTQPTISKRIKILENELGYKLFIRMRGKRQLELTVKGEQFLDLAQEWLKIYADMESLKKRNKTKLSIVSIDSLATSILPKLMISLKYTNPEMLLSLRTAQTSEIYSYIQSRQVDIGFVSDEINYPDVLCKKLFTQPYVLVEFSNSPHSVSSKSIQNLEPQNEIFQSWGREYLNWRQYWLPANTEPYLSIDTIGAICSMEIPSGSWTIVPKENVETIRKFHTINVYSIENNPPTKTTYAIIHKNVRRSIFPDIELLLSELAIFERKIVQ